MTTFLILGLVGLAILTASLLLGDLFDGFLDGLFDALAGDIFSTAVIGAFVSAFGFGGAIAVGVGAPSVVAIPVGVASGIAFGWFATWLTRLIRDGGSDGTPHTADVLGRDGTVVSPIPEDGYGKVRVLLGGHVLRLNARADQALATGIEVHVTRIISPTAVDVAPVWEQIETPR